MLTRILAGACVGLTLVSGVQTARIARLKPELHDSKQLNETYRKAFAAVKADAQTTADQCQARVDEARASAIRIERIYDRPIHVDPTGCAVRDIIGADELREALQPDTPPS